MIKGPPSTVALDPDNNAAAFVGHTADGRQFFLTMPFVPGMVGREPGREFIALYLFDPAGRMLTAIIEDLGSTDSVVEPARLARRNELLASLGDVWYGRIEVTPFTIERFGTQFGFIPQAPDDPDDDWCVIAQPGDYMCFWPPWNTGDYDT